MGGQSPVGFTAATLALQQETMGSEKQLATKGCRCASTGGEKGTHSRVLYVCVGREVKQGLRNVKQVLYY